MDLEEAKKIWRETDSSKWPDLRDNLRDLCVRYARLRVDWLLASGDAEKRARIDVDRSRAHDALISSCDILARNMRKAGEDSRWRDDLASDRRRIGDFACCVHALLGLDAR